MWDGKKFNCNEGAYWRFRALSDELCAEHRLTVIKNPKGKTPRSIYFAEKNNEPTKFNLMRQAIDFAVSVSRGLDDFKNVMRDQGYVVDLNRNRQYWTVRSVNNKKAVRIFRLGEDYTNDALMRRIYQQDLSSWQRNAEYTHSRVTLRDYCPKRCRYRGNFQRAKTHTGLIALYMHYCYLLGYFPKGSKHKPLSPEMKEAWRRIDRVSEQVRLIAREGLQTLDDVSGLIQHHDKEIAEVMNARTKIYNKLRRCHDNGQRAELLKKRDDCTAVLTNLRKEKRIALTILQDDPKIKDNIRIET